MTLTPLDELLDVSKRPDVAETGGSHNQKGIEFQRHWAVLRMFELEKANEKDFLFLFEAIQDVAVLDSETVPTAICLYQVKKKDRNEWTWAELTSLPQPIDAVPKGKKPRVISSRQLSSIKDSPLGKLYSAVNSIKELKSSGRFISNAGCSLTLADGSSAATSLPYALSALNKSHLELIAKGLETLHASGSCAPDPSRIHLERTVIPVNDPGTYLTGVAYDFLFNRSARHAGQARSFAESLLIAVSRLGAKTDTCSTFEQLRTERGYSKENFSRALANLESIPDICAILDTWIEHLASEGMGFLETTSLKVAAAAIYQRQVMGSRLGEEDKLKFACDAWLESHPNPTKLKPFLDEAYNDLRADHSSFKKSELQAYFLLRAITKCADQI